ncbi:MAG TPA: DUF6314 family protein [Jatrophihabitantaceae bacterium]|nr:DUF6314 family protein [Jatrophihabitantaceae bacterium]
MIGPDELVGEWTIEREVSDLLAGIVGKFAGTLRVSADGAGFPWYESGMLTWGDYTGPAERSLLLRTVDGAWWMCFADGRLFHPWQVGVEVVHPCAADVYRGRIEPNGADEFTITWHVTGPAKRQLIVSRMTRVQAASLASATSTPSMRTRRATT